MNKIAEYVSNLPEQEVIQIIRNFEQYEEDGKIGDCQLRSHVNMCLKEMGVTSVSRAAWLNMMAFECYRRLAHKAIEKNNE